MSGRHAARHTDNGRMGPTESVIAITVGQRAQQAWSEAGPPVAALSQPSVPVHSTNCETIEVGCINAHEPVGHEQCSCIAAPPARTSQAQQTAPAAVKLTVNQKFNLDSHRVLLLHSGKQALSKLWSQRSGVWWWGFGHLTFLRPPLWL
jgi:hypothetical protein